MVQWCGQPAGRSRLVIMPSPMLPGPQECCRPCPEPLVTNIPGLPGAAGTPGADGAPGANAFTITTDAFIMPAELGSVTVSVADSSWMAVGQVLFVSVG